MSCRSLLSCLLFLFRAWISSFGSSSGFLRRRFAFHSSRANVRRLPHEYFVKRTRPNTRKNGNGRRWTLSPSRADENYPAFQWPLIFTRPLKRSISRSFFLFFNHLQPFFPAVQGFTPYARSSPLERIRSCFHPAFWRSKNEANPRFRFAKENNFTQFRLLRILVLRIRGQRSLTILRSKLKRWRLLTSFWPIVTASSKDLPRHPLVDKRGAYPRKSNAPPWNTHIHTHARARGNTYNNLLVVRVKRPRREPRRYYHTFPFNRKLRGRLEGSLKGERGKRCSRGKKRTAQPCWREIKNARQPNEPDSKKRDRFPSNGWRKIRKDEGR